MKIIIIDEDYSGVTKESDYFKINMDIVDEKAHIDIRIPLYSSGSIICKSMHINQLLNLSGSLRVNESINVDGSLDVGGYIEVGGSLKVNESLQVNKWLRVNEWLKVDESLKVGKWLRVDEWLEVRKWLEVNESLEVGGWLQVGGSSKVGESLNVGEWLKLGGFLEVFGAVTTKYCAMSIQGYHVVFTSDHIKIGCKLHEVEEWWNFSNREISTMDINSLEWWKIWKGFIFNTHANLVDIYDVEIKT